MLLNLAGPEAMERERSFVYRPEVRNENDQVVTPAESRDNLQTLKVKFNELCTPKKNITMERHVFHSRNMISGESFNDFVSDLRVKAQTCEFGPLQEEMIRDRIVTGHNNNGVRKQLLKETDLDLAKAIQICSIQELTEKQMGAIGGKDVHVIQKHEKSPQKPWIKTPLSKPTKEQHCKNCGTKHQFGRKYCKAFGQQCGYCQRWNHFESECFYKKNNQKPPPKHPKSSSTTTRKYKRVHKSGKYVHAVGESSLISDSDDSNNEEYYIESLFVDSIVNEPSDEIIFKAKVNRNEVELKADTGAKCNVISRAIFMTIKGKESINTSDKAKLIAYGGTKVSTLGSVKLHLRYSGKSYRLKFYVVDFDATSIVGLRDSERLGIITVNVHTVSEDTTSREQRAQKILDEYAELFDESELGKLPVVYKMTLDDDAVPVAKPARKVPMAKEEKVREELERMTKLGVIEPVTEPSEWVSQMVAADKKDKEEIRICIDPSDLNRALKRPRYPSRTIEDVISRMPEAKVFAILDAKCGFWQIPLDENSSTYTTFITPYGRYRFRRMPYGIKTGTEVYQQAIDSLFTGFPCKIIVDDILVYGKDDDDLEANIRKIMNRARDIHLRLNKKKCKFFVTSVTYVGHVLTEQGVRADPDKVKAVQEFQEPKCVSDLQRFLGMTNYLAKFIEGYSEITAPLRQLLHNDVAWGWFEQQREAFTKLKNMLCSPPILQYYNVRKETVLTCDASKDGLGVACLQEGKPIAYASRALTPTEQKYSQIEKEMLAVVYATRKFHDYIYGKHIIIETDHQPLVSIMKKSIDKAPKRLQDMIMVLRKYDVELKYKKGSELYIADALSRAYVSDHDKAEADEPQYEVMNVVHLSPKRMEQLHDACIDDTDYRLLARTIQNGWPERSRSVPASLKEYYNVRDELSVEDDLVFRGQRVVVPRQLRAEYIDILHAGHPGIESAMLRAKNTVFWPGMRDDMSRVCTSCAVCNRHRVQQQREPMMMNEVPTRPWQIVATDLFTWDNKEHLLLVDSYSGFIEFNTLTTTSSNAVINKLKSHFSRYGIPETVYSDNGPQYDSAAFKAFADTWGFTHVTSSPTYAQSNGLAERAVRTAKGILQKAKESKSDPYLALLLYRNTPRDANFESPAQRLMGRVLRTQLPATSETLKPDHDNGLVYRKLTERRKKQKKYYDRHARKHDLPTLAEGTVVRLYDGKCYDKLGVVAKQCKEPRSYVVNTGNGEYRRNRKDIIPVAEPVPEPGLQDYYQDIPTSTPKVLAEPQSISHSPSVEQDAQSQATSPMKSVCSPVKDTVTVRRNPPRERKVPTKFKDYV